MPSLAELEQWMEEQIPPNLHDLPGKVNTTIQSYYTYLYSQLSEMTPTYEQIESSIESSFHSIPFVGHAITLEPVPPPPPVGLVETLMRRADAASGSRHRTNIAAGIAVVGITFAVLTRSIWLPRRRGSSSRTPRMKNGVRQEAIIVLGADTPLGQVLSHHLSAQGFIVLASVSNDQSMQAFDSLIPPSSRGYIKSIALDSSLLREGAIEQFVSSITSAKELRWPLTSAGDPYSRPGTDTHITGLVNAMSYQSIYDQKTSLHIDAISHDLNQRVVTPLATIKALLPTLSNSAVLGSPRFILSLVASSADVSSQALRAGMQRLTADIIEEDLNKSTSDSILISTLEATPSSMKTLFQSLLPSMIGGIAPGTGMSSSVSSKRSLSDAARIASPERTRRELAASGSSGSMMSTSSSTLGEFRSQRSAEYKAIADAVANVMLLPAKTQSLRSEYVIRLPASAEARNVSRAQDGEGGLEKTMLLRLMQICSTPVGLLRSILWSMGRQAQSWASCWTRANRNYYGSCNTANSRPAYGPGPGPASNTHSRSCIRPSNASGKQTSRSLRRPRSATSVSSTEAGPNNEGGSRQTASGPSSTSTPSRPSSNNGMSSSGLLSSVPSSAFGDGSEEEHFDDEEGASTDSPVHDTGSWASPNPSDHDSDTALGARTRMDSSTSETPSASRSVEAQEQYGFPSHASMQSNGNDTWMGPASRNSPAVIQSQSQADGSDDSIGTDSSSTTIGTQTPLGQSWVALGQSSIRDAPP